MSIVYLRRRFKPLLCDKEPPTFLKKIKKNFSTKKRGGQGGFKKRTNFKLLNKPS